MNRTALLIQCSREEAKTIRDRAQQERRTISGYVLNVMDLALRLEEGLYKITSLKLANPAIKKMARRHPGPRTAVLVRCSTTEASRIRSAAKVRQLTISAFVMLALRRSWKVKTRPLVLFGAR